MTAIRRRLSAERVGTLSAKWGIYRNVSALIVVYLYGRGAERAKRMQRIRQQAVGIGDFMTGNKYKNRKVIADGQLFDSKKEALRYQQLKSLEKIKAISDLQRQVKYTLIPSQKDESGKVIEQKCSYIADFVYRQNGQIVVEDVKGYRNGGAYAVFAIKRKLMLERYGIRVKEV